MAITFTEHLHVPSWVIRMFVGLKGITPTTADGTRNGLLTKAGLTSFSHKFGIRSLKG